MSRNSLILDYEQTPSMDLLPRKGSVMYNIISDTNKGHKKTINRFRFANKFVIPLYRINILPILFFGRIGLLLYTKGRKSGKTRITPLEYRKKDDKIYIFSSRGKRGDWFKNLITNLEAVKVKIGFRKFKPEIEILDAVKKTEIMMWYSEKYPKTAKTLFGYDKKIDTIDPQLFKPLIEFIEIVQFTRKK